MSVPGAHAAHGKSGDAHGKGGEHGAHAAHGKEHAPGQAKLHEVTNPATGETKQIPQSDWASYRAQGWQRVEDAADAADTGTTPGTTPAPTSGA